MWKTVLAGTTALVVVGSTIVYAQQRNAGPDQQQRWQPTQEDRAAFAAARIAALKAGLTLNADQEKNWPAFESALKDLSKYRMEQRAARRDAQPPTDPTERLRRAADALSGYGAELKKLADAQEPLYDSLDQAQKRRFAILAHVLRHHWRHHGGMGGEHRGLQGGMERRGDMGPGGGPGMRGEDGMRGPRHFGEWRDHRRFGRNGSDDGAPQLHAPTTNGEGDSL